MIKIRPVLGTLLNILNNSNKFYAVSSDIWQIRPILRTSWAKSNILDNFRPISEQFVQVLCIFYENSAYFKDIVDNLPVIWTIFEWFMNNFQPISRTLQWYKAFFSQEGRYPGYRHTQRAEIHLGTLLVKGERKGERSGYRQDPVISIVQAAHRYISLTARGKEYGTRKSYGGRQGPVKGKQRPHPAGRDPHPRGRQPGHQGERASVKETSRTQRLQPVH